MCEFMCNIDKSMCKLMLHVLVCVALYNKVTQSSSILIHKVRQSTLWIRFEFSFSRALQKPVSFKFEDFSYMNLSNINQRNC